MGKVKKKKKHVKKKLSKTKSRKSKDKRKVSKTKYKISKSKTKVRAKPTKVSRSRSRKPAPSRIKRKRPVPTKRKPHSKSKKAHIRREEKKPSNIYFLEPGDKIIPGKELEDLVFNSSHMNSMEKSIEGNVAEVFNKAFKGYLSKSPFEENDIVIHGFGVSIRTKGIIYSYKDSRVLNELKELLKPFEGTYTLNISAKSIKIFFKEAFSNNEEVEKMLRDRGEVLEEILAIARAESRYQDADWFVNWFTEDAMYEG